MEALFGLLPQMLDFQQVFLWTLEQTVASCPGFSSWSRPEQFQTLLVSLGSSFLRHAEGFKLYGGFCSSHSRVQKVLERARTDGAFKRFLDGRNPTNQHSSSLESYLIKPVQRVLKYPLLLRELLVLTEPASPQHTHLAEALASMLRVVSHINETQQIYEEYGALFHQLTAEPGGRGQQVGDVSMVDFLLQSSAVWLNPLPGLRKDPELTLLVFRRAVVLVYRDVGRLRKRMTGSPSADPDPFRFRWFIPGSALRVRPASIAGDPCVWELIHSRSEAEGRPETVFQLCSRYSVSTTRVLRALRSLLRERAHHPSLRRRRRRRRRQQRLLQAEHCTASRGQASSGSSWTGGLEAQLQRLGFNEEEEEEEEEAQRRRSPREEEVCWRSPREEEVCWRSPREEEVCWRSPREEEVCWRSPREEVSDLGRDFSVQSLSSIFNEECFYAG
uniref:TIAM Rac1 associated GEF 2b n=1 Tax=Salarias fasciatus TaxID=181472 RepID=A0A672I721_SALFA